MIVLTILLVILALAVLTVGLLGFIEKLPGNGVVGLRIPEVRKSPENWVLAHKIAGPAWMGAGAALLGAALLTTGIGGWMWLVFALLIVGALFLIGMGSAMAASTMARLEHLRGQEAEEARAAEGCCSSGSSSNDDASAGGCEPTAEECASGNACGSCSLNGACEGGGAAFDAGQGAGAGAGTGAGQGAQQAAAKPALDLDAARRAVAEQDRR